MYEPFFMLQWWCCKMFTKNMHVFVPLLDIRNEKVQLKRLKDKSKRLNSEMRSIQRKLSNKSYMEKATEEAIEGIRKNGKVLNEQIQKVNKYLKIFVH